MFYNFEILQIHQKINNEHDSNTVPDTSRINKEKQPNRSKPPNSENGNATQANNALPNNSKQALSDEQKVNQESLKGIINREKTALLSLRNIKLRQAKTEMNKINQVLTYISTNNIIEKKIYEREKLVCEKIGTFQKARIKNQSQDGKFNWKRR